MVGYHDDNVIISDSIMKMTHDERKAEIKRIEKEAAKEKDKIEQREREAKQQEEKNIRTRINL